MNGERAKTFPPRLLIVDDEAEVRRSLALLLNGLGYVVDDAASGEEALAHLSIRRYDLMLLDLRMPGMDGVEVMARARQAHPDLPIIILTGYATLESAIAAVRCGAADYLLKPASVHQIARAIQKALQRPGTGRRPVPADAPEPPPDESPEATLSAGPLTLDLTSGRVVVACGDGEARSVFLTGSEAALLARLMRAPGQVFSCSALAREVWGADLSPAEASELVRAAVHRLRYKVESDPRHPTLIRTAFGKGYYFCP